MTEGLRFVFDIRVHNYRDLTTGRLLSGETVRGYVSDSILGAEDAVQRLADMVGTGTLRVADWHEAMREEVRGEYIRQYLLGRGGLEQMTQQDWGSVGGMIGEQYRYLRGFADEVADLTPEQIAARARMYANSAREAYERANGRRAEAQGVTEQLWSLGAAEHCDDCVALAGMGWVPLGEHGTYPGAGDTQCLTNCQCHLEYR